jgi:protein-tyrosine-phosphatase/predicted ATP-grasp superfamily ATP-dependent carboligase
MSELTAAPPAPEAALAPRVLVLGDDTRAFLAVARSLGRAGFEVHAAPIDFSSPALASRYVAAIHRLPPYSLSAEVWAAALRKTIMGYAIDLVIPCDDRSLLPLHRHARALGRVRLALPNAEAMRAFFDKAETRRLADEAGVPVAHGRLLAAEESADAIVEELGLPLALKPRASYTLGQAPAKTPVRIVRSRAALAEALARIDRPEDWVVERVFPGVGVGLSVLAGEGRILEAFQHRRLREASETGGSSDRVSEPIDPRILAAAEALARRTALSGVAMFEFRREARSGEFVLLEVNARFWGSLPLAVAAGCDFPADLARLLLAGIPPPAAPYRSGVRRRDLGGDYYRIIRTAEARSRVAGMATLALELPGIALAAAGRRGLDSYAPDDPAPARAERALLARRIGTAVAKRVPLLARREARAARAIARLRAAMRQDRARVVVLCHGNICRSPFAAALLERAGLALDLSSAGTIPLDGRPVPSEALEAARPLGIDLAAHRSRWLTVEEAQAADAVLVFDEANVDALRQHGARANVLRLGDLIGAAAIADPYGGGAAAFTASYKQIERAVGRLAERLR